MFFLLFLSQSLTAQDTTKTLPAKDSGQIDILDVIHKILDKRSVPRSDSSTLHFSILPAAGYSLQTGFAGVLSANVAFYSEQNHGPDDKVSSITSSITYSQYSQIIFPIQSSIWTKKDKYNIITDWRYLKYPSTTFGLGGNSDINNGSTIDFDYVKIHQAVLKNIAKNLFAGIGYYYDHFWNVQQVNVPQNVITSFQKYGLTNTVTASGVALRMLYDSRLNQINPTGGWFGSVVYRPNFTFMGSDANWQSLLIELRKYIQFPGSKNVLAFWSYNWLTVGGKPPYLLLPSTGWDDFYNTGRGYIQGRYRGRNMIYLESEYRFGITRNGLLGGVVFANAESFSKQLTSKQLGQVEPAYGAGIRVKLNKFSSTNLCIDYGFGVEGSKGISVNLGEVF